MFSKNRSSKHLHTGLLILSVILGSGGPAAAQDAGTWAGEYTSPHGVDLTLQVAGGGTLKGELSVDNNGVQQSFPVELQPFGDGLRGTFSDGASSFPVQITHGDESGQIVLTSDGAMYELKRKGRAQNPLLGGGPANPLMRDNASSTPAQQGTSSDANFHHPDGYFSMTVPANWEANMMSGDVFELVTGVPGDLVVLVLADLEPFETGKAAVEVMPGAIDAIDGFLAQNAQILADSSRARTRAVPANSQSAARSERPATDRGQQVTIWQGLVVRDNSALVIVSSVAAGRMSQLLPQLDSAIASARIDRTWQPGELDQSVSGANGSGRNVFFNSERLDEASLARLEGSVPVIPDGEYWYDNKSGMVGTVGGPTEAYFAAGLNLGGELSPNASGAGTQVAFNGRYLHPIDLAGLEYYFGQIPPGRFWIDSRGEYGREGGPREGNLIEEIAAVNMLAASMQAQMQAQLQQQVQMYGGQGGYYGQGGGYYDQSGYGGGGGSVYQHFPNLGASGTGVGVADLGGGDSIVNAGGVLWWPGK